MNKFSNCGFILLYLYVNTYTGESRWLPLSEGNCLCNSDNYWELDITQQPISKYK